MPKLSTPIRDSIVNGFHLPFCEIYTGSIPATGDTAPTGTKLANFAVAWGAATNGSLAATVPITSDPALATGTAGYARLWDQDVTATGKNLYCTVGVGTNELQLSSLSFVITETRDITQCSIDWPTS